MRQVMIYPSFSTNMVIANIWGNLIEPQFQVQEKITIFYSLKPYLDKQADNIVETITQFGHPKEMDQEEMKELVQSSARPGLFKESKLLEDTASSSHSRRGSFNMKSPDEIIRKKSPLSQLAQLAKSAS